MLLVKLALLSFLALDVGADDLGGWIGGGTLLRSKPFTLPAEFGAQSLSATASFSGVGCYSVLVNGKHPVSSRLAPGFSTIPSKRQLYESADVSTLLRLAPVTNEITISLGMCKYGMDNTGEGLFCVGAHGATATCRGAAFALTVGGGANGASFYFNTSDASAWQVVG